MDVYRNTRPTVELRLSYRELAVIRTALTAYAVSAGAPSTMSDDAARLVNQLREQAGV